MKKTYLILFNCILMFLAFSCNTYHNDIEKKYPINSVLNDSTFFSSERFMIDEEYYMLQINAFSNSDYYEPYLLFYRKQDLKLDFLIYNPGKIISLDNKKVIGYYNEFKSKEMYQNFDNGFLLSFEKKIPSKISTIQEGKIKFDKIENDTLFFQMIDKPNEVKYHINQITFPYYDKNQMEVYQIPDSALVYKEFEIDAMNIKEQIRNYLLNK